MNNGEKWAIKNSHGQLLQSFAIDPTQISLGWFRPDALAKTKEGKKGPLTFSDESKAQVLLMTLISISKVATEFAEAKVVDLAQGKITVE